MRNETVTTEVEYTAFACFSKNAAVPLIDVSPPSGDVRAQVGSGRRRDGRAVVLDRFANDSSVLMNGSIGHSSVFRRKRICLKRRRVARCDWCWRTDGRQSTRLEADQMTFNVVLWLWDPRWSELLIVMRWGCQSSPMLRSFCYWDIDHLSLIRYMYSQASSICLQ